jgi:hypothetical protein
MRTIALLMLIFLAIPQMALAETKTVYQCWRDGTLSIATLKEPGSRCTARTFEEGPTAPNLWKELGIHKGALYSFEVEGISGTTTRASLGKKMLFQFTIRENAGKPAPVDPTLLPRIAVGKPRLGVFDAQFKASAKRHNVDEAWLRAVAHVESGYASSAVSPKGAMGVMQLMPETAQMYAVKDPFMASQSIDAGTRHMAYLLRLYKGDHVLAAAAYNAGVGAVAKYKGVPPYAETRAYVSKVSALHQAYKTAMQK